MSCKPEPSELVLRTSMEQALGYLRRPVLMLDMNGTFMFGGDRIHGSFREAYARAGGRMNYATLDDIMSEAVAWMSEKYADLGTCDNFPSFREALKCLPSASGLPDVEIARICEAFAEHECGSIPTGFSDVLHKLARRYRIALVSDIWAAKDKWLHVLSASGVLPCFDVLVFSSDIGAVKPSPLPVLHAMRAMGAGREHCFMVGDSALRDGGAAQALGIPYVLVGGQCDSNMFASAPDLLSLECFLHHHVRPAGN